MIRFACLAAVVALAACSQDADPSPPGAGDRTTAQPSRTAEVQPPASDGRAHRYSSLEDCRVERREVEEMPYTQVLCAGPEGWALRIADSDARQTMDVISPMGEATRLDLAPVSRGAFSSFGQTAEWRGPAGEPFAPDALIVRFNVSEQPYPAPPTAYLVAARLAPRPCVVGSIAPAPGQNAQARIAADGDRSCVHER